MTYLFKTEFERLIMGYAAGYLEASAQFDRSFQNRFLFCMMRLLFLVAFANW